MFLNNRNNRKKGLSLVEVIIATAIISTSMIYIAKSYSDFVFLSSANTARVQATFLLDEAVEAVKTLRGESWSKISTLNTATPYYLVWDANLNKWTLTLTPSVIDGVFTRTLEFLPVNRDVNFNIATVGTADTGSRQVSISVSWSDHGVTVAKSIGMYIFNILNN